MSIAIPPNVSQSHGVLCVDSFSKNKCKKIIDLHKVSDYSVGKVQQSQSEGNTISKIISIRQVDAWRIHETHYWVDEMLVDIAVRANETFDYNMSGLLERPQLLRYNAHSNGYDWHTDIGNGDASNRKISCSILLNDDYEGGELEFFTNGAEVCKAKMGDVICFSSFISHRVTRITKGHRWALVAWFSGSSFR